MTRTERLLWVQLRALGGNWRRQAPIGRFTLDFANHGRRLVIEVDGGVHRLPDVALRDAERDSWLRAQGYRVLRFTDREVVFEMPALLAQIAAASRDAG